MALQRIARGNGHVVEKTKAHGLVAAGVMAWRTNGAKALLISPAITASTAARAAPAARSAASQV